MWLFVTARNCIRNHERSANRRRVHESPLSDLLDAIELNFEDEGEEVRALVRALPEKYREVVTLVHWDGFPIVEAARLLNISASTARTRYLRARERIKLELESRGNTGQ